MIAQFVVFSLYTISFSPMKKLFLFLSLTLLMTAVLAGCASKSDSTKTKENGGIITTDSGLKYQDLTTGTGDEAAKGDTVSVHYDGRLTDGTKFDSSRDRDQPFSFKIGAGQVIKGWDEGVAGMKIGGVRKLIIPADLGYGANGVPGVIPGDATLIFEVELLAIK